MIGYVANTDFDWYTLLASRPTLDEVNFWQPSGNHDFHAIQPGSLFFFKLKKPHYAIGGFGVFAHASRIPASLAWDAFGEANGAPSFAEMRARIARYRRAPIGAHEDPTIGCLIIVNPMFFDESAWVDQPGNWSKNVVAGKTYDLTAGEGRRVYEECVAKVQAGRATALGRHSEEAPLVASAGPRFGAATTVTPRLGQGAFRVAVLDAYGRACAVTNEHSLPVLEAAHIRPYSEGGEHHPSNGLLLRTDLHRLFDKGFVTVTPDLKFRVSAALRDQWKNGKTYYQLEGGQVAVPRSRVLQPDRDLLAWHEKEVFVA